MAMFSGGGYGKRERTSGATKRGEPPALPRRATRTVKSQPTKAEKPRSGEERRVLEQIDALREQLAQLQQQNIQLANHLFGPRAPQNRGYLPGPGATMPMGGVPRGAPTYDMGPGATIPQGNVPRGAPTYDMGPGATMPMGGVPRGAPTYDMGPGATMPMNSWMPPYTPK